MATAAASSANGPRTLPWGTPALPDDSAGYLVSTFMMKCLLCK
jgi:hypothetical protein